MFRTLTLSALLILLAPSLAGAHSLSFLEEEALWSDLTSQYHGYSRLVYDNGEVDLPRYPGYVGSNEIGHFLLETPPGEGELYVGFGTLVNFDIIAKRNPEAAVFVDQSPDVQAAMSSFWRTLFLASPTSRDWVANLRSIELAPDATLSDALRTDAVGSKENLQKFAGKLEDLVRSGQITDADRRLTIAVLEDELHPLIEPPRYTIFRNAAGAGSLIYLLKILHDPFFLKRALVEIAMFEQRDVFPHIRNAGDKLNEVSFLRPDRYEIVRRLFVEKRDYYAKADILDLNLWTRIADFAVAKGLHLTDLYLSNILAILKHSNPNGEIVDILLKAVAQKIVPSKNVAVYQADADFLMRLRTEFTRPEPGQTEAFRDCERALFRRF